VRAEDEALVRISRLAWRRLVGELSRRGEGRRESGAFLLARRDRRARRVAGIVYFDEIDPHALNGAIAIRGEKFTKLWTICRERRMRVIADVHTHPGAGVSQSPIDAANPMVAKAGHVAVILPHFAQRDAAPERAGIHIYEGSRRWRSFFGADAARALQRSWL
jgi:proteasome lid subunit RPN8/RPN11